MHFYAWQTNSHMTSLFRVQTALILWDFYHSNLVSYADIGCAFSFILELTKKKRPNQKNRIYCNGQTALGLLCRQIISIVSLSLSSPSGSFVNKIHIPVALFLTIISRNQSYVIWHVNARMSEKARTVTWPSSWQKQTTEETFYHSLMLP